MNKDYKDMPNDEHKNLRDYMTYVKNHHRKPSSFYVITYGCQMNARDSETLAGMFLEMAIPEALSKETADIILVNTCCVRENAERRAFGNIAWLKELRKENPSMIIGVCGCMIQQEGIDRVIAQDHPYVNFAFGTSNLHHFPRLLLNVLDELSPSIAVHNVTSPQILEGMPVSRKNPYTAFVTVMYGCNNFCSYCVVPYVRGRERSREPESIINEVKTLRDSGVQEIILLGQNVNSYGLGLSKHITFPDLLKELELTQIPRIRFMTSHPKDFTDKLIQVLAESRCFLPHVHLPVQSGSNEILRAMNRRYTREMYIELVSKIRHAIPCVGITTDIIVGFPGETENHFCDTMSLVKQIGFDAAYTFVYSARKGTVAYNMPGTLPKEITRDRILRLIALQKECTQVVYQSLLGSIEYVLAEGLSKRGERSIYGKGRRGITVNFLGSSEDIGRIVRVKITETRASTLRGFKIDGEDL